MSSPTLKVEIAFTSEPLDTTPTWVDVSIYVRRTPGVTIRRGRQSELDQFDAGYLQLTLSNRDRRFDPSYAAGPNFGNLIPRKQIRVTATWSAVDYVMFTGWVTGWPQGFRSPDGKDATVTIEAVDALAWLANNNLPADLVYTTAAGFTALAFFLRNADTTRWSDASNNGYSGTITAGTGRTTSTLAPGMASTAISFDHSTMWGTPGWSTASTSPASFSLWLQTTDETGLTTALGGGDGAFYTNVNVTSNGRVQLRVEDVGGATLYTVSSLAGVVVNDGIPHHVVITVDGAAVANSKIYIDGVNRTGTISGSTRMTLKIDTIGGPFAGSIETAMFSGSIQDVAVFNKELSAVEVLALYSRSYGFLSEDSATRVTRLLDDVGWPAGWRDITTTPRATVGELVYNSASALEKLQEVQRTEQGRIFASKAGNLTFLSRYYAQDVTAGNTVQQIFSDDGGATALPYSTFGFQFNDIDVTNSVTVTTPDTWASASDATSILANGLQSKKVDTILATFAAADSMSRGLVAQGKDPMWRAAPILVYPEKNTTRWDDVLLLELGYRVGIEITPMKVSLQNAQEVTIEQIEWLIEGTTWSFVVAGSPCRDIWFIVGQSLVAGPKLIGY